MTKYMTQKKELSSEKERSLKQPTKIDTDFSKRKRK